jgi:CubicO group peptidase (beta-lactamase class C family)/regulation of enolase protein 1 (concanavalin A-like superfamily)
LCTITSVLTPARAQAQDGERRLDASIDSLASKGWFSGQVLITRGRSTLYSRTEGIADRATGKPVGDGTRFNLASLNKTFTAVAIAQLAEQGRLTLDDRVGRFLPRWANATVRDSVTIRQLLTHTAGMGLYWSSPTWGAERERIRGVNDYAAVFASEPLLSRPGTRFEYSNNGFIVLGAIIEAVSGQSYYEYVQRHILDKAGMSNTSFPAINEVGGTVAVGYTSGAAGPPRAPDFTQPAPSLAPNTAALPGRGGPAGGGYSTAQDLVKFGEALLNDRLVSRAWRDSLWTPRSQDPRAPASIRYGLGFSMTVDSAGRVIDVGHNGGTPGGGSELVIDPRTGTIIAALTNHDVPGLFRVMARARALVRTPVVAAGTPTAAPVASAAAKALVLSDEFDNAATLANWQRFDVVEGWPSKTKRAEIRDGRLLLEPATSGWYADFQAPFLFKQVTGDFTAHTRVHVTGIGHDIPNALWSLAGLMVRAPRAGGMNAWTPNTENWLFITTGIAARAGQPVIETKTTVNSQSTLRLHDIAPGPVELLLTRRGAKFELAYSQGGEFRTLATFDRPDLPATIQLGVNAYTDWESTGTLQNDPKRFNTTALTGAPDMLAAFEYLHIQQP